MWRRIFLHPFLRKVFLLSRGIGAAYLLQFIASPLLSRLYTPADMGIYGVFLAFVGILTLTGPLRFEVTVLAAKDDREAWLLSAASYLCTLVLVPLMVVGVWAITHFQLIHLPSLEPTVLLCLLPTSTFAAWMECSRYTSLRADAFGRLSAAMIAQSISRVGVQITLGFLGVGWMGLLIGEACAKLAGCTWLMVALWKRFREQDIRVTLPALREIVSAYRQSPILLLPSSLIDLLALSLTVPLVSVRFGAEAAGSLSFVQRLVAAPLAVISTSVADTFHSESSKLFLEAPDRLRALFRSISIRLFLLGLPPTLLLAVFGPTVFRLVFGAQWAVAGRLAVPLAPLALAQFTVGPLSRLVFVLKGQKLKLIYDVTSLLLVLAVFSKKLFPQLGFESAITLYSLANCGAYALMYVALAWLVHRSTRPANAQETT